jgi:Thiamine pyrophosphate enzyme, C-terminal TPP binding domain
MLIPPDCESDAHDQTSDDRVTTPARRCSLPVLDLSGLERRLRAAVRGEVCSDAASRAMYTSNGSNFRQGAHRRGHSPGAGGHGGRAPGLRGFGAPVVNRGETSLSGETIAVLHHDDLNQVTWEMRAMEGAPKFTQSQALPDVDYADFAAGLGLRAISVDKPDQIGDAWDRALSADRPTVLHVRTDTNVPPIPPHATFEQVKDSALAMLKGDEDRRGVIVEGVRTKVQEFLPHRDS